MLPFCSAILLLIYGHMDGITKLFLFPKDLVLQKTLDTFDNSKLGQENKRRRYRIVPITILILLGKKKKFCFLSKIQKNVAPLLIGVKDCPTSHIVFWLN